MTEGISATRRFWCERAWLDGVPGGNTGTGAGAPASAAAGHAVPDVLIEAGPEGITEVGRDVREPPPDAVRLPGLVLPGFANAHSHAFHRALRGRTSGGGGTFWTWRERMYEVAGRLDPDSYFALARATYAEMALAGVTCVGEFHYVHHQPGGTPYADPNAMGEALSRAAREAGIRLTLLDACYLTGGIGKPLAPEQLRFSDGSADRWAERVDGLRDDATTKVGAAVHSVRAVPPEAIAKVAGALAGLPLHVHLSEQPAENAACREAYGVSPAQLLADHGALGPDTTVVHATHLEPARAGTPPRTRAARTGTTSDAADAAARETARTTPGDSTGDVRLLGDAHVHACLCPTTERDLGDGIGPARALADAGASICLGSDQHTVIDPLEEARALEMHERLATGERGRFSPAELVDVLTWRGHAALGWTAAGRIAPGAPCDLVALRLDTVRTAGTAPDQAPLAATAADVDTVVVGGRTVVGGGRHLLVDDVPAQLATAIGRLTA